MNKLVIIGASGHGKVVADIAIRSGYTDIVFLDDGEIKECAGFPVVGKVDSYNQYKNCDFIIAIGNGKIREKIYKLLINQNIVTLVHPNAIISRRVTIGRGTVVMAGAVINSDTQIGDVCIINTCASVDHDCNLKDFVHVSVGAHIAGTVKIGTGVWIGAGATIINNIEICDNTYIGAGATVINDILKAGTYVGVPTRKVK